MFTDSFQDDLKLHTKEQTITKKYVIQNLEHIRPSTLENVLATMIRGELIYLLLKRQQA